MRLIDGPRLWRRLKDAGLTGKSLSQFSMDDMLTLAAILADHVEGPPLGNLFRIFPKAQILKIEKNKEKNK